MRKDGEREKGREGGEVQRKRGASHPQTDWPSGASLSCPRTGDRLMIIWTGASMIGSWVDRWVNGRRNGWVVEWVDK